MEHCLGGKQGARKEGSINIVCIGLGSSRDVTVVDVNVNRKVNVGEKNPWFSTVTCCFVFLLGLGLGSVWHHNHHAVSFSTLGSCVLHKFSCWVWQQFYSTVRRRQEARSRCSVICINGIHTCMDSALLQLFQRDRLWAVSLGAVFQAEIPLGWSRREKKPWIL